MPGSGAGGSGQAGKVKEYYIFLTADQECAVIIGAGGDIATVNNTDPTGPEAGKNGVGGSSGLGAKGAQNGGTVDMYYAHNIIIGANGQSNLTGYGGGGGGAGGSANVAGGGPGGFGADNAGDGADGSSATSTARNGGPGGPGAVIIEYPDPDK
jgi:hypothetical protein